MLPAAFISRTKDHKDFGLHFWGGNAMVNARLEVRDVSWGIPHNPGIISDLSFTVQPGEILGVVGPNGAGKSTLLRLLYRYIKPLNGTIRIDGDDIWTLRSRIVAQKVAVVLQEGYTDFPLTVQEVVGMGRLPHQNGLARRGDDLQAVSRILADLNLGHLASRTINNLSGGERQMVMVAKALAQEPKVLILDEPTNHLDIRHKLEILALVKELGITTVCTLHDLNSAANLVDKILVLAKGRKVGFGRFEDTLSPQVIADTFSVSSYKNYLNPNHSLHYSFHL